MQVPVRYTVVNQGGQPVIRAVPVPRRPVRSEGRAAQQTQPPQPALFDRIRRLGFR
jgi:hypothetical protein